MNKIKRHSGIIIGVGRGGGGGWDGVRDENPRSPFPFSMKHCMHIFLEYLCLFVAVFMGEGIPLDVSTTQPYQHIELCTSAGNSHSLQLSYTTL